MTRPQPIYRAADLHPAYQLRYAWTGWLAAGQAPLESLKNALAIAGEGWEHDGLRMLESSHDAEQVQLSFSAKPDVAPVTIATRAKGRLQHALRAAGTPTRFSRKVALRSVGDTTFEQVERYIRDQVARAGFVDARHRAALSRATRHDSAVDLQAPTSTLSGRYWYNLHIVLVSAGRKPVHDAAYLEGRADQCLRIAARKGWRISALSVLPDHAHIAFRGAIDVSPQEIVLALMNNTAYSVGQKPIWSPCYYAGTFSEYDMRAIRAKARRS
jgi:REP element-mobilizing transposase RayT